MNKNKILIWTLILVSILAVAGFSIWAYTPLGPMLKAIEALISSSNVVVEQNSWIIFLPVEERYSTGLIIYPGGRVDPRSYAPGAHQIAENGVLTVFVPMPFNLAVFGSGKVSGIIEQFPEINNWVIAGHSLGGVRRQGILCAIQIISRDWCSEPLTLLRYPEKNSKNRLW